MKVSATMTINNVKIKKRLEMLAELRQFNQQLLTNNLNIP